jgi:hypothetical protein
MADLGIWLTTKIYLRAYIIITKTLNTEPMHIAYSAIRDVNSQIPIKRPIAANPHHSLRLKAYKATCQKYNKEIAAIQQYLPGWAPACPVL